MGNFCKAELQECKQVSAVRDWRSCADAVAMWTVPVPLRPAGQAFQVICMHAFGDVPLPPIIGVIQGDSCGSARVSLYADGNLTAITPPLHASKFSLATHTCRHMGTIAGCKACLHT